MQGPRALDTQPATRTFAAGQRERETFKKSWGSAAEGGRHTDDARKSR